MWVRGSIALCYDKLTIWASTATISWMAVHCIILLGLAEQPVFEQTKLKSDYEPNVGMQNKNNETSHLQFEVLSRRHG